MGRCAAPCGGMWTPGTVEGERRGWTGKVPIGDDVGKPVWWAFAPLPAAVTPMLRCRINGAGIWIAALRQDAPPLLRLLCCKIILDSAKTGLRLDLPCRNGLTYGTILNAQAIVVPLEGRLRRASGRGCQGHPLYQRGRGSVPEALASALKNPPSR